MFSVSVLFLASDIKMPPASGASPDPVTSGLPLNPTQGPVPRPPCLPCAPQLCHLLNTTFTTDSIECLNQCCGGHRQSRIVAVSLKQCKTDNRYWYVVGWAAGRHPTCKKFKNWVMRYWRGYLSAARCKWFAYGPADATATQPSLAPIKSRMVYLSGASLPGFSSSSSSSGSGSGSSSTWLIKKHYFWWPWMTFHGCSAIGSLLKCNFLYCCVAVDMISADRERIPLR